MMVDMLSCSLQASGAVICICNATVASTGWRAWPGRSIPLTGRLLRRQQQQKLQHQLHQHQQRQ
jgi:hypothetical protein